MAKPNFSHHPLLVSVVSILVGGFGLYWVQLKADRNKALMEKRLSLINEVVDYRENAAAVLRFINLFTCQIEKAHLSRQDRVRREEEFSNRMSQIYRQENLLGTKLQIYFPNEETLRRFEKLQLAFHDGVNTGTIHLQKATPSGKCLENERAGEMQNKFNQLGKDSKFLLEKMAASTRL